MSIRLRRSDTPSIMVGVREVSFADGKKKTRPLYLEDNLDLE